MAAAGNPGQWGKTWPETPLIEEDIALGRSYVCSESGVLLAAFMFAKGPEPLYEETGTAWLNKLPYGVMHRLAAGGGRKGAGAFSISWCIKKCGNLRMDTHEANKPMQGLLYKLGFSCCGHTLADDGTDRLAFQKCII